MRKFSSQPQQSEIATSSHGATLGTKGALDPQNIWKYIYIYIYSGVILIKKKAIFSIFLQQILSDRLLLTVTCG